MARKKPMQYVPLEERPEFIAALEVLPVDPAELEVRAERVLQLYHDAMLAADVQALDDAHLVYRACVIKLNGGTNFGSASIQDALAAKFAAPAGQVPKWGQAGEFLLEIEGMRIVVKMDVGSLANHCGAELSAVDFDKPFISRTGYRHQFMAPAQHVGRTVDQAVRAEVLELLAGEGKAVAIDQEHGTAKGRKVYPWLADALAGVRPDGQMAMFGDAPKDPNAKVALSNAERQRRHRLRLKELADTEGLKAIALTQTDRMVLSLGLLAHEDLFHRPKDWETSKKSGFDSLLVKLWPEGDNGRYLAEPKRSTYRPAATLRDELERSRTENLRLKAALRAQPAEAGAPAAAPVARSLSGKAMDVDELNREVAWVVRELNRATAEVATLEDRLKFIGPPALGVDARKDGDFLTLEVTDAPLLGVWTDLPTDFARCATALGLLRLRNSQHAELARAVEVLQERLRAAGLCDRVTTDRKQWYWNTSPIGDYRATSAPEYMERQHASPSSADQCEYLARQVKTLEDERALLESERNKAFAANRTLTERLRRAGLPTDYRPQPGE